MMATTDVSVVENSFASSDYSLLGAFSHPLPIEIVISTIVWLMCFLAVFGNILIFVVILRDKQLRSNVANMYILNLASADLCVGINSLTMNNIWRYTGNWPFQRAVCTFWTVVDYSACMQAAFAVTLISLDRYLLVTKYLQYRKYQSRVMAGGLITFTWTVALVFYAIPILGNELWPNAKAYGVVSYSVTCDFGTLYILPYNIAQIAIGFAVPAVILTYLNVKVYSNILQRSKGLVRVAVAPAQPSATTEGGNDPALQHGPNADSKVNAEPVAWNTKRTYKKHRKAAITLALIVGMFSICWTPYYVLQLLFVVDKIKFSWLLWNGVYYTVWVNSAINPFIYAATSPRIRRGIIKIICFWNTRLLRKIRPL
ncbi:beta-2 adrenergic receptor-like [Patiria miniata]|uniref:G-protein coupled receptors family 1 profile domain-containing protein n=1 Tax=Patiria miniata TaxID=46514 RepID=A0A914BE24_PATMI|nr:beta-2 adrenergic receptor-like [Patiria miniata]